MHQQLPSSQELDQIIANVNAVIGIGVAFPASQFEFRPTPQQQAEYVRARNEVIQGLRGLAAHGFYIPHLNSHGSLEGLWGWAITSLPPGGQWAERRHRVPELYAPTLEELQMLREVLGRGVDARGEVLRELRESRLRANELFVVMAVHGETQAFLEAVIDPAATQVGLHTVFIAREDPEEAISEAILSGIRRAVLVIADLTFARPNCYFEAGYARGAFRRVLLTCRRDHDPRSSGDHPFRVHFDVDQNRITWWAPDTYDAARRELVERLGQAKRELGIA